jgi:dihydrolipoamide dehydrogenase
METRRVDVAVIGAGTAGLIARREAERHGARALMIESGPYGTTCARVGCMPSKLLIAAADAAHAVAGAGAFGVRVPGPVHVDGAAVLARVRRERDRFVGFVLDSTERVPEELRLRGHAHFEAPGVLSVDAQTRVEARAVVVATGSRPEVPPLFEGYGAGDGVLTSDDVFEMEDLPASVAVVGAGVLGLELAQALHRLGVRTEILSRSEHVGHLTDPAVAVQVREALAAEMPLHLGVSLEAAEPVAGGFRLRWRCAEGGEGEGHFERVLLATGRRPRLEGLGLEKAGVTLSAGGVPDFDTRTMQVGDLPVFLAGDASGDRAVLHEAAHEGRIAGSNAARYPDVRAHPRLTPLSITFTHPEIALVGRRHEELDPEATEIGEVSYADQGRARVMRLHQGLVRVYASRACGTLLGAEMFGPRVEHTAHLLSWAVAAGQTVHHALSRPFYHPVVEEGIETALRDLSSKLKLLPRAEPLECGPGH